MKWTEGRAEYFAGNFPVAQISDGFLTHCASMERNDPFDAMNDYMVSYQTDDADYDVECICEVYLQKPEYFDKPDGKFQFRFRPINPPDERKIERA